MASPHSRRRTRVRRAHRRFRRQGGALVREVARCLPSFAQIAFVREWLEARS